MKTRNSMRTEREISAGGVVCRPGDSEIEVVLVGQDTPERWRLPKGHVEKGETWQGAALREVAEETGLQVELVCEDPLGDITYWYGWQGTRYHKTVRFFLMSSRGGDVASHDWENDRVEWFLASEAMEKASFEDEKRLIDEAVRLYRSVVGEEPRSTSDSMCIDKNQDGARSQVTR